MSPMELFLSTLSNVLFKIIFEVVKVLLIFMSKRHFPNNSMFLLHGLGLF